MGAHLRIAVAAAVSLAAAVPVTAQPADRGYITVNALFQAGNNTFEDRFEFRTNLETATTETVYPIREGVAFDVGGGVRVWKNLGAGVAVSRFTRDAAVQTESSIPHPFFDARPRSVSGGADLGRTETAVHAHASYMLGREGGVRAIVFGGPSFVTLEQDFVTDVLYDETYPYDTAAFVRADSQRLRASAVTFNAGADLSWMFSRNMGIGGLLRFARATVDLDAPGGRAVPVHAGGLSGGAGLRIAF